MNSSRNYLIKFQIFGKKMSTTITAKHVDDAVQQLRDKLKIDSVVVKEGDEFNEIIQLMDDIEGMLRMVATVNKYSTHDKAVEFWNKIKFEIGDEKFSRLQRFTRGFKDILESDDKTSQN